MPTATPSPDLLDPAAAHLDGKVALVTGANGAPGRRAPGDRRIASMSGFTIQNLGNVEDSAPKFGFEEHQEARFATGALDAEATGVSYHRMKPGKRQAFGHRHVNAEEVYVVLAGSGRIRLGDEIREITTLDAIRVAPEIIRAFEAGPDGLEVLAFGPRHQGDGEVLPGFWSAD
jgi:mannose-6-phosphate isomerase-like protein (cupin superfamily)